jgi:hypothetical protein
VLTFTLIFMLLPNSLNLQTSNAASLITVPTDYPTIQSAIDAASAGDTIKVLPGTYVEQLTISKSLTLVGSGARSTITQAPAVLDTNVLGLTYIAQINGGATVSMKGFKVDAGTTCDVFFGVTVLDSATLNLDTSDITGCYQVGVTGSTRTPDGPQTGHATITPTQELSVGATAEVVFAPRSAQSLQIASLTGNPIPFVLPTPASADLDG